MNSFDYHCTIMHLDLATICCFNNVFFSFFLQESMAAGPSIISTGDSGYPDSNWSGPPKVASSSSESSVASSKNDNNR